MHYGSIESILALFNSLIAIVFLMAIASVIINGLGMVFFGRKPHGGKGAADARCGPAARGCGREGRCRRGFVAQGDHPVPGRGRAADVAGRAR